MNPPATTFTFFHLYGVDSVSDCCAVAVMQHQHTATRMHAENARTFVLHCVVSLYLRVIVLRELFGDQSESSRWISVHDAAIGRPHVHASKESRIAADARNAAELMQIIVDPNP